jgi:diguanylate cyclase (GGDEF)-like protein
VVAGDRTVGGTLDRPGTADPAHPSVGLLRSLPPAFIDAECGVRVIHDWLESAVAHWELRDLVLVLERPQLGRQVLRVGRKPLEGWSERIALQAPPGLYPDPPVRFDPAQIGLALCLYGMALELDITRGRSLHDPLTGLYNRRGFQDSMSQAVEQSRRYGWPFSLLLLDLDGFKRLNDRHGHAAGDVVLEAVGEEIGGALRRGDVAARIGGDEFAVIVAGADPEAVGALVARLEDRLRGDLPFGPVALSWGAASCPAETTDLDELFLLADRRLYAQKGGG